ncbi:hypothetical protein BH23GEM4_BH23GEM4_17500 [soil metagenome]
MLPPTVCAIEVAYAGTVGRWTVFRVDFDPVVGLEQAGERRPAIVVSNTGFNTHFDGVTVLPLAKRAGKRRKVHPSRCCFPRVSRAMNWKA